MIKLTEHQKEELIKLVLTKNLKLGYYTGAFNNVSTRNTRQINTLKNIILYESISPIAIIEKEIDLFNYVVQKLDIEDEVLELFEKGFTDIYDKRTFFKIFPMSDENLTALPSHVLFGLLGYDDEYTEIILEQLREIFEDSNLEYQLENQEILIKFNTQNININTFQKTNELLKNQNIFNNLQNLLNKHIILPFESDILEYISDVNKEIRR